MNGHALAENAPMLALAARLGFALTDDRDPDLVRLERPLPPPSRGARWVAYRLRQFVACRPVAVAAPAFAVQAR
jgi:hypothetical protein